MPSKIFFSTSELFCNIGVFNFSIYSLYPYMTMLFKKWKAKDNQFYHTHYVLDNNQLSENKTLISP